MMVAKHPPEQAKTAAKKPPNDDQWILDELDKMKRRQAQK
jgi:hypothetical protein